MTAKFVVGFGMSSEVGSGLNVKSVMVHYECRRGGEGEH